MVPKLFVFSIFYIYFYFFIYLFYLSVFQGLPCELENARILYKIKIFFFGEYQIPVHIYFIS